MGLYDRAARRATKAEPLAVVRRLGELAGVAWRYRDWAPTQTTPQVGERDQTADRAMVLDDLRQDDLRQTGKVWLGVLEFQARHDEDKLDDLLAEAAQFRRDARHGPLAQGKYAVLPVLVYLVGRCPDGAKELDLTTPAGFGVRHRPVLWEVGGDSAAGALEDFKQGKTTWGILFWVALMAGAGEEGVVKDWLVLVTPLPARDRADLIGIALVFAELAGRGQVWRRVLEGAKLTESAIVNEWIAKAEEERELKVMREVSLRVLNARFPGQVPREVVDTIKGQSSPEVLGDWIDQAAVLPLEEFRAYLRR
jgi:hypothetical protein